MITNYGFKILILINFFLKNLESLEKKVATLKNLTEALDANTTEIIKNYQTNTEANVKEALKIHSSFEIRSDSILREAEKVTNGTQKLLDNANNALESLNKINRSISGESFNN